jgi:hypothetical protein
MHRSKDLVKLYLLVRKGFNVSALSGELLDLVDIYIYIYVAPNMRTISLCKRGSPYANILAIPAHMHTGIPICVRRSPCA